jgi:hypothetical protein
VEVNEYTHIATVTFDDEVTSVEKIVEGLIDRYEG